MPHSNGPSYKSPHRPQHVRLQHTLFYVHQVSCAISTGKPREILLPMANSVLNDGTRDAISY